MLNITEWVMIGGKIPLLAFVQHRKTNFNFYLGFMYNAGGTK